MKPSASNSFNKSFFARQHEAEAKALHRREKALRGTVPSCEEKKDAWPLLDNRPYCANCGKLKGSETKSRYFPDRPCMACGSTMTKLRDFDGNEIDWQKWRDLQAESDGAWLRAQEEAYLRAEGEACLRDFAY